MAVFQTVIFSTLAWVILYLAVAKLFGQNTALLTVNLIAITPVMVQRNAPADRDALCLFLTVTSYYFYIRSYQSHHHSKKIAFAFASGVVMAITGLCWQGVGVISLVIVCTEMTQLLFGRYNKIKFYSYLVWSICAVTPLVFFKQMYRHLEEPYVFVAIGVPTLFLLATAIYTYANKRYVWIPFGAGVLVVIWLLVVHSIGHSSSFTDGLRQFQNQFFAPLEGSRLAKSIGEFRKPGFWGWINWPGLLFIPIIFGISLLVIQLASSLKFNGWISATVCEIFLVLVIFSRILSGAHEGKDTTFTTVVYLVSLLGFMSLIKRTPEIVDI